jgi:hypothetical protein
MTDLSEYELLELALPVAFSTPAVYGKEVLWPTKHR